MFLLSCVLCLFRIVLHARIQRWGIRTPLKNHKNIGFLSNVGPDPLKITKLPGQHSMLGHHQHASKTFPWRADDGPLIVVVFGSFLIPSSTKKNVVRVGPPLGKPSGSAHVLWFGLQSVTVAFSSRTGVEIIKLEYSINFKIKPNDWLQPIIELYFEFENELKFYNLES